MANAVGMIQEAIWRDPHWRKLSRSAQALYMQLLSQKELDCAGILPLQPEKWATGCNELTVEQMWADLNELQAARFVFHDTDTYEAFVRSYMRNSNVLKVPNMIKSALRSARMVASEMIREVLAAELRLTNRSEAAETANEIDQKRGTLPEPFPNPSRTLSEPTGVGKGKGTGVTFTGNQVVGEAAPPICPKHKINSDSPCAACKKRREWDEVQSAALAADELQAKRVARERAEQCPNCKGTNTIDVGENEVIKCDHLEVSHA
jgi:hypothetical protein